MSLSAEVQHALDEVADTIRENVSDKHHLIEQAAGLDSAFDNGEVRAPMLRHVVYQGARMATISTGIDFRPICGGGRELRILDGTTDLRIRIRRARVSADGTPRVSVNSESALAHWDADAASTMFSVELWVLLFVVDGNYQIETVMAAEVIGFEEGSPGYLKLGPAVILGSSEPDPGGVRFTPDEDDELDGFDEGWLDEDEWGDDLDESA